MNTVLTVIVDNISDGIFEGEWGLCILAQYGDTKIMLDAGSSDLFAENMKRLGVDIADIDHAVLSHAHYDHANGMPRFFEENSRAKLYLRESAAPNCYAKKFIFKKYIGIPKEMLERYRDRIEFVSGDHRLCEGVYLIPHKTCGLENIGRSELMYQRKGRRYVPDDFSHEQSLVLDTDKGLVILNSCSHGGAVNIINEVARTFPDKHIHALVGGLHLFNKSEEIVRDVANAIDRTGIDYIYTGHCTKNRAYAVMKEVLKDRLFQLKCGLRIEI